MPRAAAGRACSAADGGKGGGAISEAGAADGGKGGGATSAAAESYKQPRRPKAAARRA